MMIGDRVKRKISIADPTSIVLQPVLCDCVVEYIHPERRYYTLRVLLPGGRSFCVTDYFYPKGSEK